MRSVPNTHCYIDEILGVWQTLCLERSGRFCTHFLCIHDENYVSIHHTFIFQILLKMISVECVFIKVMIWKEGISYKESPPWWVYNSKSVCCVGVWTNKASRNHWNTPKAYEWMYYLDMCSCAMRNKTSTLNLGNNSLKFNCILSLKFSADQVIVT